MYIFLDDSFVSIAADPVSCDRLIVRAHRSEHIRALMENAEIWQISTTERGEAFNPDDYRYRAVVSKKALQAAVVERLESLPVGTFRGRIADPVHYDACNRARFEMYALDRTIDPDIFKNR